MERADIPARFPIPFADAADAAHRRTIPTNPTVTPGQASLSLGFPPVTMQPISSGGIPPDGRDMNGILYESTLWDQWAQAGGPIGYDTTFSAAIGGYPQGSLLAAAATVGNYWLSTVDNNTTNPDVGGAGWQALTEYVPAGTVRANLTGGAAYLQNNTLAAFATALGFISEPGVPGSLKLPGGITVRWGATAVIPGGASAVTAFNDPFPVGCFIVIPAPNTFGVFATTQTQSWNVVDITADDFTLYNGGLGVGGQFAYIAIGF